MRHSVDGGEGGGGVGGGKGGKRTWFLSQQIIIIKLGFIYSTDGGKWRAAWQGTTAWSVCAGPPVCVCVGGGGGGVYAD